MDEEEHATIGNGEASSPGRTDGTISVERRVEQKDNVMNADSKSTKKEKTDKDSKAEEAIQPVSYLQLFRFSDRWDILLLVLGFIGACGNGAAMPLFSIIFGNLMNSFGQNLNSPDELQVAVNDNVVKFIYIGLGAFVGAYLQMACFTATAVRQVNRIRHRYLGGVLRQDIGYFDTQATSGRLLQGLNEDCITIQQGIGEKVGLFLFNIAQCLVGIIIAFIRGWDMTLVMLAVTPALAVMGYLVSVFLQKATAVANKAYARANSIAQQALGNIRTVYSFNGEERTVQAYADSLELPLRVGIKQGFLGGLTLGITNCVAFCAYALALWYGGQRIAAGAYTGGDVLNVLFAALIGGFSLGQAAPHLQYFAQAKGAGGRVFTLMDRKPDIDLDAPGETLETVYGRIEFQDVVFAYPARPDVRVFRNFDLCVPAGKTVALVGESGSGKSTVIGLIERYYDPQRGQVMLDGVDIRHLQLRFLRSQLGLVSQEPTLFATTIAANIAFGNQGATMEDIIAAAQSANAHNFISGLPKGYDTHVGEKGVQMSGGQKQRIAIARAILKNPKVLLLDEATSALDAESEHIVQEALDKLMVGRTTLMVAHRLSTVINSDIIAVVKKGQVVERGNHQSLMAENGAYAALVALQQAERDMEDDDEAPAPPINPQGPGVVESFTSQGVTSQAGSSGLFESRPPLEAQLSPDGRQSLELSMVEKAVSLTEAAGAVEGAVAASGGATRPFMPPAVVQKGVSGWRRFVSYRHKSKSTEEAPLKPKEEEEETLKKVPLSRVAALNKPELPAAVTGLIGSGALGFMMPAFSLAFSALINVFYTPDIAELKSGTRKWSLVFVGIGMGAMVFAVLQSYSFNYMGQKLGRRVRLLMIRALLRQEVGFYDQEKNSSGVLTSKLSSDAIAVKGQFGDTMGMVTQNIVTLISALAIAFSYEWKMTLVVLGSVPIIGVAATVQFKMIVSASSKEDKEFAEANQTATESLSNIRTIAAFGMERQVSLLYGEKLEKPTQDARRRANVTGLGFGFSQFSLFAVYSLSFWFAGIQVKNGDASFQDVLRVFFAIFMAAFGAAQAQMFYPDVAKGKSATQRVFNIIDRQPLIDASSPEGEQPLECVGTIELKDISFAYPARPEVKVFRRFNLSVPAGHTVALVGESGSGKSTVIGLIERFYDPLAGQVLLDGRDIRSLNLHWLRERIALVSQEPVLFNMTAMENIRYGRPDATLQQVMVAARAANAHTFLEALPEGYDTQLGESGIQLSGGQKQRVAIARAIIKDPRVLLLDEATSALDAESERIVQEALDRLMVGRSTVVVAHRLSTVRDADSIAMVVKGRVIEQGTHDELMAKPHGSYARLVRHQLTRSTVKGASRKASTMRIMSSMEEAGEGEGTS